MLSRDVCENDGAEAPCYTVKAHLKKKLLSFLEEDCFSEDITTHALALNSGSPKNARLLAKQKGIICGIEYACEIFLLTAQKFSDRSLSFQKYFRDGDEINPGDALMEITALPATLLAAERTVLNLMSRLSGISTLCSRVRRICGKSEVRILDTRKTTPGLRYFEKYAVKTGGLINHRMNLADAFLFKDNHWKLLGAELRRMKEIIARIKDKKEITVEVKTLNELDIALDSACDVIMLDNMTFPELRAAIARIRKHSAKKIELSGSITPENLKQYLALKPDRISMGYLTHSAMPVDISMKIR